MSPITGYAHVKRGISTCAVETEEWLVKFTFLKVAAEFGALQVQ